jgi:hypothetical protein
MTCHAPRLLATAVYPKIASERLGHSKVGITLDLYSHVMPGMQERYCDVDCALQAAIQNRATRSASNLLASKRAESLDISTVVEGWPSGLRHRS